MSEKILNVLQKVVALASPYRSVLLLVATALALWLLYRFSTRWLKRYLERKAHKPENIANFLLFWRYSWVAVGVILGVISLSGSLAALGISAAFLGMILGWSLQAPVTGIAAWLMIILKRPFKIGDRIIVSGIIGDVVDINLTHIVLNQVGGTIGGEEKSGRGVMIPNATLFQQVIYNYTFQTNFILDEVPVLVTYESDIEEATQLLIEAARVHAEIAIKETGEEPYVRAELGDSGIRLRLRYQTLAKERQKISSAIVFDIVNKFGGNDKVEFAYPHTEVIYRPKGGPVAKEA